MEVLRLYTDGVGGREGSGAWAGEELGTILAYTVEVWIWI